MSDARSADPDRPKDAAAASIPHLLRTYAGVLSELRRRGVLRTNNPPAGDLAEYLVAATLGGVRLGNSAKGGDVLLPDTTTVQVKARVVGDPLDAGQRQLSAFRCFDFAEVAIVLFDEHYGIFRAVRLPCERARALAAYRKRVNAHVLLATDAVLGDALAVDITAILRERLAALL